MKKINIIIILLISTICFATPPKWKIFPPKAKCDSDQRIMDSLFWGWQLDHQRVVSVGKYVKIVDKNATQKKFEHGWIKRAIQ